MALKLSERGEKSIGPSWTLNWNRQKRPCLMFPPVDRLKIAKNTANVLHSWTLCIIPMEKED
jgi:hypothetical protein